MTNLVRVKMNRGGRPLIVRLVLPDSGVKHTHTHNGISFQNALGYITERANAQTLSTPHRMSGGRRLVIKDLTRLKDFLGDYAYHRNAELISFEMFQE